MLVILGLVGKFVAAMPEDGQEPPGISAKAGGTGRPGSDEFGAVSGAYERQTASEAAAEVFGGRDRAATPASVAGDKSDR